MTCKIPPCTVQSVDVSVDATQLIVPATIGDTVRLQVRKPGDHAPSDVDGVFIGLLPSPQRYKVAYNQQVNALAVQLDKVPAVWVESLQLVAFVPPDALRARPSLQAVPDEGGGDDRLH